MKKLIICALASACISAFAGFAKYVPITVTGYNGATLTDFQILVRINTTKLSGVYTDVQNAGADLKFTDTTGLTEYPYEVDVWNPAGESLVWVKLPSLHSGDCAFRMYYGDADKTTNAGAVSVWTGYHGVWHFNADLKDSGVNGYDGTDFNTVGATTGAVGTGWTISESTTPGDRVGAIACLTSAPLEQGDTFTWSGWIKTTDNNSGEYMMPIAKRPLNCWKNSPAECDGGFAYLWNPEWGPGGHGFYCAYGHGRGSVNCYNSQLLNNGAWRYVVIAVQNGDIQAYLDGSLVNSTSQANGKFTNNTNYPLVFGNESSMDSTKIGTAELPSDSSAGTTWQGHGSAWKGSIDEYRLSPGVMTAQRVSADYLTQTADMTSFGAPVELTAETVSFIADVTEGFAPFESEFTAVVGGLSGSLTYYWDFDNDGNVDETTDVPTVKHAWNARGVYNVKLEVSNGGKSVSTVVPGYIRVKGTIYVDSTAAADGNGSLAAPFTTLQEAVGDSAAGETILVRGGENRTYSFATYNDSLNLSSVGVKLLGCDAGWNLITNWPQTNDMPRVTIAADYAQQSRALFGSDSFAPPIDVSADNVTISGLSFFFGQQSFKGQNYGGHGLIDVNAGNLVVEACGFFMTDAQGHYAGAGTDGVIYGASTLATNCKIRKCYAWLGKYRAQICFFFGLRTGSEVSECLFENIDELFSGPQGSGVFLNIISNIFLNCRSESTGWYASNIGRGSNYYPAGGEIAYNRAIHNDGVAGSYVFWEAGFQYGGSWDNVNTKVHHNTVVGYTAFYNEPFYNSNNGYMLQPAMFDNLLVLPDGTVFVAEATGPWSYKVNNVDYTSGSPFKAGTKFCGNAVLSDAFGGGSMMTANEDMDIFANLGGLDTTVNLTVAPQFMNTTDPASPDYYRVNADAYPWVVSGAWTDSGEYPAYIGAVAPGTTPVPAAPPSVITVY